MAQSHPSNAGNHAITVDQIVAALQQLGITLSDGAAPSAITASGLTPQNPASQNPASTNTGPPATPVAPPAAAPPAAAPPAVVATVGVPVSDSDAPGNTFPSWFTLPRHATAAAVTTATAATTTTAPASAAPASSPTSTSGAEEDTSSPEDTRDAGCPHVCAMCHAKQSSPKAALTTSSLFATTDSWYVVIVGCAVGVFQGWSTVEPLVMGVSGFSCKCFPSCEAAEAAFADALDRSLVKVK